MIKPYVNCQCASADGNGWSLLFGPLYGGIPGARPPVMHSLASASTTAWLIHQKFELGIPLYRQEKEWEALELSLGRATMSN